MINLTLEEQKEIEKLGEFISFSGIQYITDKWIAKHYPPLQHITKPALEIARKLAMVIRADQHIGICYVGENIHATEVLAVQLKNGELMFYHPKDLRVLIVDEKSLKLRLLYLERLMQYRTGHMIYDLPEHTMTAKEAIALMRKKAWQN